jgi:type I restriction enzyme S subunit
LLTPGNLHEEGGFRPKDPEKFYVGAVFPSEFKLEFGQMLLAMTEQAPGLLGSALFVPDGATYLHNQRLGLVQNVQSAIVREQFLFHLFNSIRFRAEVHNSSTGAKVKHTSPQRILSVRVFLPPMSEQASIAQFLDQATSQIDVMIEEATKAINLLQERRSALISAAVTGKFDVRLVDPVTA